MSYGFMALGAKHSARFVLGQGIRWRVQAIIDAPVTIGLSGSPSKKVTTTSWPIRGKYTAPQLGAAIDWLTRSQHELCSSF